MSKPTKGRHGGARAGSGRPKNPVLLAASKAKKPLDYLLSVMADDAMPVEMRVTAAKAALPYCHSKPSDLGVKESRDIAARGAEKGTGWEELLN